MQLIVIIALLVCGLVALGLNGRSCTEPDEAARVLRQSGFTDVAITGYAPFKCGEGDYSQTGFIARAVNGERVVGTVCCGAMGCTKGCTVRID